MASPQWRGTLNANFRFLCGAGILACRVEIRLDLLRALRTTTERISALLTQSVRATKNATW